MPVQTVNPAPPRCIQAPPATRPDQTRPDPTRTFLSPGGGVPTRPDQTQPDPTRPDQTRPDPTRPDQTRPDPTRPDQTRPDPQKVMCPEVLARGPGRAGPGRARNIFRSGVPGVPKKISARIFLFKNDIHWVLSGFRAQKNSFGTPLDPP